MRSGTGRNGNCRGMQQCLTARFLRRSESKTWVRNRAAAANIHRIGLARRNGRLSDRPLRSRSGQPCRIIANGPFSGSYADLMEWVIPIAFESSVRFRSPNACASGGSRRRSIHSGGISWTLGPNDLIFEQTTSERSPFSGSRIAGCLTRMGVNLVGNCAGRTCR